jgi:uncharacterized protein involved in outer membrane biogenesis
MCRGYARRREPLECVAVETCVAKSTNSAIFAAFMKKLFISLGVVLAALVLVAYVAGQFFLGSIVKAGVNKMGPSVTQSKVVLAGASISPFSGAGTLTGLSVGNPQGWSDANALYLGRVDFAVQPSSLLKEVIVINDLSVTEPAFAYETHIVSSNIGDLLKNIEASVGAKTQPVDSKTAKPHKFIVRHLRLQNAKVSIGVGAAAIPLPMPDVELTDLGVKEGGLTSSQLSFAIMRAVMPNIITATTQAAGKIGGTMGAAAGDAVKKAGEGLQRLLGGKN